MKHYHLETTTQDNGASYVRRITVNGKPITRWQDYMDCHHQLAAMIQTEDRYTEDGSDCNQTGAEFLKSYRRIQEAYGDA